MIANIKTAWLRRSFLVLFCIIVLPLLFVFATVVGFVDGIRNAFNHTWKSDDDRETLAELICYAWRGSAAKVDNQRSRR